jgi:hypothetical protein
VSHLGGVALAEAEQGEADDEVAEQDDDEDGRAPGDVARVDVVVVAGRLGGERYLVPPSSLPDSTKDKRLALSSKHSMRQSSFSMLWHASVHIAGAVHISQFCL